MEKFIIRKEISALVKVIKDHSDRIGNKEFIPQTEINFFMDLVHDLQKKTHIFEYLNAIPKVEEIPSKDEEIEIPEIKVEETVVIIEEKLPEPEIVMQVKITESIPAKPQVPSAKMAIGINDKFQFISELFGKNAKDYELAIEQFNTCETPENAEECFKNLAGQHNWDQESDTVLRLQGLVNARFK